MRLSATHVTTKLEKQRNKHVPTITRLCLSMSAAMLSEQKRERETKATTQGRNYHMLEHTHVSKRPCFHPIKSGTMHHALKLWIEFSF